MRKYIPVAQQSQAQRERQRERKRKSSRKYREDNPGYADKEQRRNAQRHAHTWVLDPTRTSPVILDGEADDMGRYTLLQTVSEETGIQTYKSMAGVGLTPAAYWLRQTKRSIRTVSGRRARFIGFALGYDTAQLLHNDTVLTEEEKRTVWNMRKRKWGVVRGPDWKPELHIPAAGYAVEWGKKSATITFDGKYHERILIEDMFSLSNKSLIRTIEEYAKFWTPAEHAEMDDWLEAVKLGKAARGKWKEMGYSDADIETTYQEPELRLMLWYVKNYITLCKTLGLAPRSVAGPAPLARALAHKYGVTSHIKPKNYDTVEFQRSEEMTWIKSAFFGGNIQLSEFGHLPNGYWSADIISAYPEQIRKLPCMAHGFWVDSPAEVVRAINQEMRVPIWSLIKIRWKCPETTKFGPFPVRGKDKSTCYPLQGEGIYGWEEVAAFFVCHPHAEFTVFGAKMWHSTCTESFPFADMVEETFALRAKYKAEGKPENLILKLALNSLYGVMAQTAGAYRIVDEKGETTGYKFPKLSNLAAAAFITSGCRARVMRMVAQDPENAFAIATDAVNFHENPLNAAMPVGKALGSIEITYHGPSVAIAPGIYAHQSEPNKIRGIPGSATWHCGDVTCETMYDAATLALQENAPTFRAEFEQFQNPFDVGADQDHLGHFIPAERVINFTPTALRSKRDTRRVVPLDTARWYVLPYTQHPDGTHISHPYTRPIDAPTLDDLLERSEDWEP